MRFVYKIYSGFDGFRPAVIPERMEGGRRLRLGWRHYIDVVEKGWECWVYFHGPHKFEPGVYAQGIVDGIDHEALEVSLRVRDYATTSPITDREVTEQVATLVARRFRQVFVWPDEWTETPQCSLAACTERRCGDCKTWAEFPLIEVGDVLPPSRLRRSVGYEDVVPAYWAVPRRCYEYRIAAAVREITRRFTDFKMGEMGYAYPFACAMFEQLRRREQLDFDFVVPIPLSPDKARTREKHRTRFLARELGQLMGLPVREILRLTKPVSKRRMMALGYTAAQFEARYLASLEVEVPVAARRILLVDDVMTRGSTVAQALRIIARQRPDLRVVVVTAAQMIVKEAVYEDRGFRAP